MKTMNILLICLIMGTSQHVSAKTGELGVLLGSNISRYSSANLQWRELWGIKLGLFTQIEPWHWLTIQPALMYDQVGSRAYIPFNYGFNRVSFQQVLHCLELPVQVHISPFPGWGCQPQLTLGGYGAYIVSARERMQYVQEVHWETATSEVNRFQYGAMVGLSIYFSRFPLPARCSFLYRRSLSPVSNEFITHERSLSGWEFQVAVAFNPNRKTD